MRRSRAAWTPVFTRMKGKVTLAIAVTSQTIKVVEIQVVTPPEMVRPSVSRFVATSATKVANKPIPPKNAAALRAAIFIRKGLITAWITE